MSTLWLTADWPAPVNVRTCITTRLGGCSQGVWKGFNLGDHVGDDPVHVAANRAELERVLGCRPAWLTQVHGTEVCKADPARVLEADASWTDQPGIACTIMTADCLPALFCTRDGQRVAAAHAGWRGPGLYVLLDQPANLGRLPLLALSETESTGTTLHLSTKTRAV